MCYFYFQPFLHYVDILLYLVYVFIKVVKYTFQLHLVFDNVPLGHMVQRTNRYAVTVVEIVSLVQRALPIHIIVICTASTSATALAYIKGPMIQQNSFQRGRYNTRLRKIKFSFFCSKFRFRSNTVHSNQTNKPNNALCAELYDRTV